MICPLVVAGDVQGVWQIGLDVGEAEEAEQILTREGSWRESSRLVRQEAISRGTLPLIIDSLHRYSIDSLHRYAIDSLHRYAIDSLHRYAI